MSEKITDKRPQFFLVEDAVIEHYGLDPYSGWIYVILVKHADRKTGEAFPGIARLTTLSNMSRAQVMRSIATLESKGLIRVERDPLPVPKKGEKRERKPNHYFILAASSIPQQLGVVSDGDYPSIPQQLGVVSGVDHNKNQLEQESINKVARAKITRADELIFAWAEVMGYSGNDIGATFTSKSNRLKAKEMLEWATPATPEEVRKTVILKRQSGKDYAFAFLVSDIPILRAQKRLSAPRPITPDDRPFIPMLYQAAIERGEMTEAEVLNIMSGGAA